MGRKPRCSKDGLNKGAWTPLEDKMLMDYFKIHGEGKWSNIVKETGLKRCGKSCRLRWMNYLRPNIKRGNISDDEEDLIIRLHKLLGNRWSLIAGRLPGRTDNEIKNYWHTNIAKKSQHLQLQGRPKVDRKQSAPGSANGAASSFKNQSNIESQCTTRGVVAAATTLQESTAQDHQDSIIAVAQSTNSNLKHDMPKTCENESSSKGLASGDDHNSSNIMMDYNYMEDFSKILDSDFTKFSDIHDIISTDHHSEVDGDHHGVSNSREITEFPEKLLKADWSSNKCVQADQGFDFMSLLSFLDDEWTEDALGTTLL